MKSNKWLLSLAVGFLCCGSAYSQTTVKGTITSESGEPLIGATITVKNSTDGTVTDIDGNYSLKTKKTLSSKDLLLFSYVGYKTLQKNYTGNTMNVKLAEESQQLSVRNTLYNLLYQLRRTEYGPHPHGRGESRHTAQPDSLRNVCLQLETLQQLHLRPDAMRCIYFQH